MIRKSFNLFKHKFLLLALSTVLVASTSACAKKTSNSENISRPAATVTETVTKIEKVTNASGEVETKTSVVTEKVTAANGEVVTKADGEAETKTEIVVEEVTKVVTETVTVAKNDDSGATTTKAQSSTTNTNSTTKASTSKKDEATKKTTVASTTVATTKTTEKATEKATEAPKPTEVVTEKPTEAPKPTEPPHVHNFSNATCTSAATCSCGATGNGALGHDFGGNYEVCARCGVANPGYIAPKPANLCPYKTWNPHGTSEFDLVSDGKFEFFYNNVYPLDSSYVYTRIADGKTCLGAAPGTMLYGIYVEADLVYDICNRDYLPDDYGYIPYYFQNTSPYKEYYEAMYPNLIYGKFNYEICENDPDVMEVHVFSFKTPVGIKYDDKTVWFVAIGGDSKYSYDDYHLGPGLTVTE